MSKSKKNPKVPIYTQRVLQLLEEYKAENNSTYEEVYALIGSSRNNHANYKKGLTAFTVPQIIKCAQEMNVTIDWICGLTDFRNPLKKQTPIEMIERGVKELKAFLK